MSFVSEYRSKIWILWLLLVPPVTTKAAPSPPNVVMIISDDQAWTDYGFMGHSAIRTPHLDQLAARSAVFKRGYVPIALCRPSLATMITGLYPHQHGITGNDPAPDANVSAADDSARREQLIARLDNVPTLPQLLATRGYLSHQSGKWWEGSYQRGRFTHGMTRGFPQQGGRHGDDGLAIGRKTMAPVLNFVTDAVEQQKPFFLWYAPFLPHTPHNPPERLLAKYRLEGRHKSLARYYAMCEWFDETCGTLLQHLERSGVAENTIIVYVTDNGWIQRTPETVVSRNWKPSFAPKSKQSPYDGGTRTPILISWPGQIAPRRHSDVVSSIDLAPTILSAAGMEVPENLPGLNLLPLVTGSGELSREFVFGESFAHDVADVNDPQASLLYRWVIRDRWKLLLSYDGQTHRYRAVHQLNPKRPQLFDLLTDPHEESNLAANHPKVVADLAAAIEGWWPANKRRVR